MNDPKDPCSLREPQKEKQSPKGVLKKGVFKTFAIFTGKRLRQSLFLIKLQAKQLWHSCFPANFAKILRTSFFIEHL